ncbi:uncharacterized protein LOC6569143 [Drosophila grimshawi]|uniref:uncharacterized protein LOC6569143 n=1 Tax=Drosophila grimshawi TaxID=7222 RepID=UPI0013EF4C3A|nr:uncharacterized protein LOC6569143 [Drosophila grimshawi]
MSCGRITKLNVNIDKSQTHITYDDNSTRFIMNNPLGFVFRNMGAAGYRSCGNRDGQARGFLQRHFGRHGSLRRTPSMRELLARLQVEKYLGHEFELEQQQEQQQPKLIYTWALVELPVVLSQRATIFVHPVEQLVVLNLEWHLQSCKWRQFNVSELEELPKCYCVQIKEKMDILNELMKSAEPQAEEKQHPVKKMHSKSKSQSKSESKIDNNKAMCDMNANILELNACLKQLNSLLEKQNQSQRCNYLNT